MNKSRIISTLLTLAMTVSFIPAAVFADDHPANGWYNSGTNIYPRWVYYRDGEQVAGEWIKDGGKWYYLDLNGVMVSNCGYNDGSKVYLLGKDGALVTRKGWVSTKTTFYLPPDASQDTTEVVPEKVHVNWYYLRSGGVCVTGWKKISGKWYYFYPDFEEGMAYSEPGRMVDTPTELIDDTLYIFNSNGSLIKKTGWVSIKYSGVTYWLYAKKGGIAYTGWKKSGGKWYYLQDYGPMATNRTLYIDGLNYDFDKSGVCTTPDGYLPK